MSEDSDNATTKTETIPSVTGRISAIASAQAPILFFDAPACWGMRNGVASITLTAGRMLPNLEAGGGTVGDHVVVGYLKMDMEALMNLKSAVDDLIMLASGKPEGPAN